MEEPNNRDLAVEISGSVTLNGSTVTDPGYHNGPFTALVDGRVNTIALLTLAPTSVPSGAANSVLAQFTAAATSYGSLAYPTNGATNYMPLYLTKSEPFGVKLYNSATSTGALHSSAVKWNASVVTLPRLDSQEPDADNNHATYADRTTAPVLNVEEPKDRWLFRRTAGTNEDIEDWHKLTLTGGNRYRVTLTNNNGTYGTFSYDVRLVTSSGTAIVNRLGVTGTSITFDINASVDGTFYVQVAGTPVSRRGASVYFGRYTIELATVPVPVIGEVTPSGVAGQSMDPVTFSAEVTGNPTSWNWSFGGGADRETSTEATPTVRLGTLAATFQGQVTATNAAGTSIHKSFSYRVVDRQPPTFQTVYVAEDATASSIKVLGDRLYLAYWESGDGDLRLATAPALPSYHTGWTHHTVEAGALAYQVDLEIIGGVPVLAYRDNTAGGLKIARGLSAVPTSASGWQIHIADTNAVSGIEPSLLDSDGRIAVVHQDLGIDHLRFSRATSATPTTSAHWVTHSIDVELTGVIPHHSAERVGSRILVAYGEKVTPELFHWRTAESATAIPTALGNWTIGNVRENAPACIATSVTGIGNVGYMAYSTGEGFGNTSIYEYTSPGVYQARGGNSESSPLFGTEALGEVDGRLAYALSEFSGTGLFIGTPTWSPPIQNSDWEFAWGHGEGGAGRGASVVDYHERIVVASVNDWGVIVTAALSRW